MRSTAFTAALTAGLITVGFCIAGDFVPFRPNAMSERAWHTAWTMFGMIVGIVAAQRIAKGRS
jgi:hypothetical protein